MFHVFFWFYGPRWLHRYFFWCPLLATAPARRHIRIDDIDHALSHQCRFGGHTRLFYSVAEHSVRVSHLCAPEDALWGLLHDASEAYLNDVATPLKELPEFEVYRTAERALQRAIAVRFGLAPEQPASVTEIDRRMLQIEMRDLLVPGVGSRPTHAPQKDHPSLRNRGNPESQR